MKCVWVVISLVCCDSYPDTLVAVITDIRRSYAAGAQELHSGGGTALRLRR